MSSVLDRLTEDGIPVRDIRDDVSDFEVVSTIARDTGRSVRAIYMGENALPVPLLPAHGALMNVMRLASFDVLPYSRFDSLELLLRFPQNEKQERGDNVGAGELGDISWETANKSFFDGLSEFLAARISGVPWLRRQQGSGSGVGGIPLTPSGGSSSGQWWTALTKGKNLSLYYAGTHAVRYPPNYLSGTTAPPTPFPIFLPMGTCYLGADAGPSGNVVWDTPVITVPSQTPSFAASKF
ncbi:MAG TPA: hypothetical protein VNO32_25575 [Candidatus Acidoferrum sp.]|nr:hypothetical protein [Candidatus Acidoferrum sp.]